MTNRWLAFLLGIGCRIHSHQDTVQATPRVLGDGLGIAVLVCARCGRSTVAPMWPAPSTPAEHPDVAMVERGALAALCAAAGMPAPEITHESLVGAFRDFLEGACPDDFRRRPEGGV